MFSTRDVFGRRLPDMVSTRDVLGRGFGPQDGVLGLTLALAGAGMFGVGGPPRYYHERRPHKLEPGECTLRETGSKRSRRRERARQKGKQNGRQAG